MELEPQQLTAGGNLVIVGENMEPDSDRVIVLAGHQLVYQFETVKTDADGMFTLEVTVPSFLPSGVYQIQAIGDETISADLDVIGTAGAATAGPVVDDAVVPRKLDGIGLALLIGAVGLLTLAGGWLVIYGERLAGRPST